MRRELIHFGGRDYLLVFQHQNIAVLEIESGPEGLAFLPVLTTLAREIFNPLDEDRLQIVIYGDGIYLVDHAKPPCQLTISRFDGVRLVQELTPI